MSDIKELIRQEIERLRKDIKRYDDWTLGFESACERILDAIDTMPDESEQPTMGYDEAYLNEKIAKASKSWEGVDVDKFMDEIRGREPVTTCDQLEPVTDCHDLEEKKTFDDYLKVCPSGRRKINVAEILEEEREMKIWHEMAKEYPPIGETVCILWNDGIITTDVWDEEDSISPWMKYWCLSSDICLPKE